MPPSTPSLNRGPLDAVDETLGHLRHDLIKHLDIPRPGAPMTRAGWEVLQRRLFSEETGITALGSTWILRLRRRWDTLPELLRAVDGLAGVVARLASLRPLVDDAARTLAPAAEPLVRDLHHLVDAVRTIEHAALALAGRPPAPLDSHAPPLPRDDADTLDWLLGDPGEDRDDLEDEDEDEDLDEDDQLERLDDERGRRDAPPRAPLDARGLRQATAARAALDAAAATRTATATVSPATAAATALKRRVLVVDDRLQAIERFHAIEHMRERFEWVTLCELEGPCWSCPHRHDCGMKRARTFRELEGALRRAKAAGRPVDVLLMDVRFDDVAAGELLPTPPGFEPSSQEAARALQGPLMVRALRDRADLPATPVVLMTGRGTLPAGAERLLEGLDGLHFVDDEASLEALTARLEAVARRSSRPVSEGGYYWGRSPAMLAVREQIELLAMGPRPVLLTGPSGSGKSFLVEEVLLPLSARSHLVTMDLSALPETLVESELFGHVKGAFSGAASERKGLIEEADGGILFIDEIGHLTPENQRKLLLFLQDRHIRRIGAAHRTTRHVDVKVVVATHLDLREEVEAGRFRFDLYMRLRPATQVRLPSLAERTEDLDDMMRHLVDRLARGPELAPLVAEAASVRGRAPRLELSLGHETLAGDGLALRLPQPTVAALRTYPWPGNTRELESVLDTLLLRALADARRVATAHSPIIEVDHYLTLKLLGIGRPRTTTGRPVLAIPIEPAGDLKQMRHRLERSYLIEAFRAAEGDMERMTEMVLGSPTADDRHRLTVRMNQLGLKVTELKMTS